MKFSESFDTDPSELHNLYLWFTNNLFHEDGMILLFHLMAVISRCFTQDFNKDLNSFGGQNIVTDT